MIKLSERLKTIKSFVPNNTVVADIGADHGYLICSLALDKVISKGYAVENKKGPYSHLCSTIKENNLEDVIKPYLGDGIMPLEEGIDTLILAGMGSENIVNILNSRLEYLENIEYIIVDSHTNLSFLRQNMNKLGYKIINEKMVLENKVFYEIILFQKGSEVLDDLDLKYGPLLRKSNDDTFKCKYQKILNKNEELLKMNLSSTRLEEIGLESDEIKKILK